MKKILTTIAVVGTTVAAFAQGTVSFENYNGSGNVTFAPNNGSIPGGNAPLGSYTVALLYSPQASGTVAQSSLTQIAIYSPSAANGDTFAGAFTGPTVTTPAGSGSAIFEVVAWTGNFANWTLAQAGAAYIGQTAEFVNAMGSAVAPVTPPINLSGPGGSWDGNLVMVVNTPEPTTIALGGLGAAALLAFRRRK